MFHPVACLSNLCYTHNLMKKVLLLNPPGTSRYLRDQYCSSSAKAAYYWPPIDLLVLSGILNDNFEVRVLDCIAGNISPERAAGRIRAQKYHAIISLTSTARKDEDFSFLNGLKTFWVGKLVLNAGFLREDPRRYLKEYDFIDALITDYTRKGIAGYLNGDNAESFSGLFTRRNLKSAFVENSDEEKKMFSYPLPRHDLFPLRRYRMPQTGKRLFTCSLISTGCPYDCAFCSSSRIPYRLRDVGNLAEELSAIKGQGIREVHFPDFTFTADRSHTEEVCRMMLREKLNLSWDCLTRVDCLDRDLAVLLKQAGCHTIQFGVESGSEPLLRSVGKAVPLDATRRAFRICHDLGIQTIAFFMIGLPGDSEETVRETIGFARELDCDFVSFSLYVPDYGSRLRRELEGGGLVADNIFNFDRAKFPFFRTERLSREQIWQLRNRAIREFYLRPAYLKKMIGRKGKIANIKTAFSLFRSLNG